MFSTKLKTYQRTEAYQASKQTRQPVHFYNFKPPAKSQRTFVQVLYRTGLKPNLASITFGKISLQQKSSLCTRLLNGVFLCYYFVENCRKMPSWVRVPNQECQPTQYQSAENFVTSYYVKYIKMKGIPKMTCQERGSPK